MIVLLACLAYHLYRLPLTAIAGPVFTDRLLTPNFGSSYGRATAGYAGERSWLAYDAIRGYYRGWRLIGFDRESVLFSSMYAMAYTGPTETLVLGYSPDLSPEESAALSRRGISYARHARPAVGVIPPSPASAHRVAVALRTAEGQILIVPLDQAPPRFAELDRAR